MKKIINDYINMRKITLIVAIFLAIGNLWAQKNIDKSVLLDATKMIESYNNKDFSNYVDYLLPKTYGNDPAKREQFVDLWKKITIGDTSKITIIKILKTSKVSNEFQAALLTRFHNQEGYILGISNDKGKNWLFTTSYSKQIQFDQIIETIPTIDPAFSIIIDPKFNKRTKYEIGKFVAPFNFSDINGKLLSSDTLKGKIIVMNFWGIFCGPCIMEMPELNTLVEKMKGKEIVFIAPAISTPKEMLINNFLPKHPFNYQIVLINQDDYSVTSFPTHIVIDQNLKVIDRLTGYSPDNIKKLENSIAGLLKK
jgi:thiol-disulfide isomerase/thioredoxin